MILFDEGYESIWYHLALGVACEGSDGWELDSRAPWREIVKMEVWESRREDGERGECL